MLFAVLHSRNVVRQFLYALLLSFPLFGSIIVSMSVQQISPIERARRARLVKDATHSVEMEGGIFSAASDMDLQQYIWGNLTIEECIERNRYRYGLNNG